MFMSEICLKLYYETCQSGIAKFIFIQRPRILYMDFIQFTPLPVQCCFQFYEKNCTNFMTEELWIVSFNDTYIVLQGIPGQGTYNNGAQQYVYMIPLWMPFSFTEAVHEFQCERQDIKQPVWIVHRIVFYWEHSLNWKKLMHSLLQPICKTLPG